jgi:hypothetical protein
VFKPDVGESGERKHHVPAVGRGAGTRLQDTERFPGKLMSGVREDIFMTTVKMLEVKEYIKVEN